MKTYWRTSAIGAELIQENAENPKDENVLAGIDLAHGYCHTWTKNDQGNIIKMPMRFSEYIEKAKADVETYLFEKGILTPNPSTQDEKVI